jgi:hypothetical protein
MVKGELSAPLLQYKSATQEKTDRRFKGGTQKSRQQLNEVSAIF